MSTPEGQTYKEHMAQWVEAIKRDTTVLNGQDSLDSLKIMAGEYPDPIQVKAGINPAYVEKYNKVLGADMTKYTQGLFDQYFNIFTMMFEGMSDEMKDAMSDEMKDMQKRFDGMKNWMTANIPTIALNNAYGIFTEDDLDFVAKTQTLDTRKLIGLLPMNPGDMVSMGIGVMKDYLDNSNHRNIEPSCQFRRHRDAGSSFLSGRSPLQYLSLVVHYEWMFEVIFCFLV
jgi:hypothetical protein